MKIRDTLHPGLEATAESFPEKAPQLVPNTTVRMILPMHVAMCTHYRIGCAQAVGPAGAANFPAGLKDRWSATSMYCAVNAAAPKKGAIRGIDDGVYLVIGRGARRRLSTANKGCWRWRSRSAKARAPSSSLCDSPMTNSSPPKR